jgi:hypothetical protein
LGGFLPIGGLLALDCLLKITEVAQIYGRRFPNASAMYVFILTKVGGQHFGRLSHKLIWSP